MSLLRVLVPQLPSAAELDLTRITNWNAHFILQHFCGPPVFSWDQTLLEFYAQRCAPTSATGQTWDIPFKAGAQFSDGSPLTALHWLEGLERLRTQARGIHFNPSRDLATPPELRDNGQTVRLHLKQGNSRLFRLIGKPESSVLKNPEESTLPALRVSSGALAFQKSPSSIIGVRNQNFPGWSTASSWDGIEFLSASEDPQANLERMVRKEADLAIPFWQKPALDAPALLNAGLRVWEFGSQTYFVSWTANGLQNHPAEAVQAVGQFLHAQISQRRPPSLQASHTLLQGPGLGRSGFQPPAIPAPKLTQTIQIACPKTGRALAIGQWLEQLGFHVQWVETFADLFTPQVQSRCQAIVAWNDFHSKDPYISLYNALNPARPIIADPQQTHSQLLDQTQTTSQESQRDAGYRRLELSLLQSGQVVVLGIAGSYALVPQAWNVDSLLGTCLWSLGK